MAFCSHGLKAAKDMLHKLTPPLENIIDASLKVTGAIMNSQAWPVIESLIKQLPGGALVDTIILTGVKALTDSKEILDAPDAETVIKLFIADISKYDPLHQHALLIKLASIMTAGIHAAEVTNGLKEEAHKESEYDSLTQLKAVVENAEAKAA